MITVKIIGGLGNQMFCYSIGYILSTELGQNLAIDISDYYLGYFRKYVLDCFKLPVCTRIWHSVDMPAYAETISIPENIKQLYDAFINIDNYDNKAELKNDVAKYNNPYLYGYGGAHLWDAEDLIALRDIFRPSLNNVFYETFRERVAQEESVAIHIRRTDFLPLNWSNDATLNFYKAAINYCRETLDKPRFYIFSDDIDWAIANIGGEDITCVNAVGGEIQAVFDLLCMSECKYRILTRKSTFGRWACFLSADSDKYCICENCDDEYLNQRDFGHLNMLFFEQTDIEEYKDKYSFTVRCDNNITIDFESIVERIERNDNNEALINISNIFLNNTILKDYEKIKLVKYSAIAYMMSGNKELAIDNLRVLRDEFTLDYDFYYYYAVCLDMAGRHLEALCYATIVSLLDGSDDIFETISYDSDYERELIETIAEARCLAEENNTVINVLTKYVPISINKYIVCIGKMLKSLGFNAFVTRVDINENIIYEDDSILINSLIDTCVPNRSKQIYNKAIGCSDVDRYFTVRYSENDREKISDGGMTIIDSTEAFKKLQAKIWPNFNYSEKPIHFWDNWINDEELIWGIKETAKGIRECLK